MNTHRYAEIGITTNFSFLRGGSHPQDYVHEASDLRLPVIGIADHNTLAGVVGAYKELENHEVKYKPKLLIGSRLTFMDGTPDILVYPRDREAYGRLGARLTPAASEATIPKRANVILNSMTYWNSPMDSFSP